MSPIIARAALRAATRAQPFARSATAISRRAASTSTKPQRGDYGRLVKHVLGNGAVYIPTAAVILGWPFATAYFLDDHMN